MTDLLVSNAAFTLLFLCYLLFLKRLTFFRWNRFYLLFALFFAVALPFVSLPATSKLMPQAAVMQLPVFDVGAGPRSGGISAIEFVLWSYWAGVALSFMGFALGLTKVFRLHASSIKQGHPHTSYYLAEGMHAFSFFGWVQIGNKTAPDIHDMVLRHERVHQRQWHSVDVVLFAFARTFFWFNPFVHLAAREVRLNHEFIADEVAHRNFGTDYQYAILNQAMETRIFPLTNSFFSKSLIKNRIIMMNKKRSKTRTMAVYALAIPMLAAALWLNACKEQSMTGPEQPETVPVDQLDKMPAFKGGDEALYRYLGENIVYPQELKDAGISGMCYIGFIISEDGSIGSVEVAKSDNEQLEPAALKVIEGMPDWEPGVKDGQEVKVKFVLPIKFALKGE